jgi:hypothetical protein
MLSLRFFLVATVACSLLVAGPALAARTQPVGLKTSRPTTTARRSATARPGATARAVAPAGNKGGRRTGAPAAAPVPRPVIATPVAEPKLVYLTGVVLNPDGRPCPGVCVFPTTNTHQITVTDAQGNFQLQVPAQKALSLQADFFGLGSSRVTIDGNTPQPVRIVLGL